MRKTLVGFSLVELSIVLVILGLLTGGILSGQSLIRAAELKSVSSDLARYQTAVYSFRDRYQALPGDMPNATQFWQAENATPATCQTTASTTAKTCDGNGDGQVADGSYEMFRFWQHLANAGLIEGSYNGVAGSYHALQHILSGNGQNAPRSKLSNAGYGFSYINFLAGDAGTYGLNYGNTFWFGAATGHRPQGDILKPEEAWNIDTKLDDGKPASGKVIARPDNSGFGAATSCTTDASQTTYTGTYNLSNTAISCALMVMTGY